jgi:predicted fused transcriptional regulator/phosphomethylpyrimidine kinase
VEQVASAIRAIEKSPTFVNVMPEVSVNIVALEGDSDSPEDVVAIPGRIVRVRNQARAMSPPERGASRHMARMLLLVRKRVPGTRAALNLKYDGRMAMALKRLGLKSITIGDYGSSGSEDPTVEALASKLLLSAETFDVVVDSGGRGIEPSVYLFGGSAPEAAAMAVRIADLYSAG